ncbi:MAG: hypothetical protein PUD63_04800, partial [Clostridia bacterium]|nr:hypothetical protein [Clostridia bacterium]
CQGLNRYASLMIFLLIPKSGRICMQRSNHAAGEPSKRPATECGVMILRDDRQHSTPVHPKPFWV